MTDSSLVIENGPIEKFLERERGGGSQCLWKTEYTVVIQGGQSVSCDVLSIITFNPRLQTKLLKLDDK